MPRKQKGAVKVFALKSAIGTAMGTVYRMDVVVARSLLEALTAVEKDLGMRVRQVESWTPEDPNEKRSAAALATLLERDPKLAQVLSGMISAFMDTDDGTNRG